MRFINVNRWKFIEEGDVNDLWDNDKTLLGHEVKDVNMFVDVFLSADRVARQDYRVFDSESEMHKAVALRENAEREAVLAEQAEKEKGEKSGQAAEGGGSGQGAEGGKSGQGDVHMRDEGENLGNDPIVPVGTALPIPQQVTVASTPIPKLGTRAAAAAAKSALISASPSTPIT